MSQQALSDIKQPLMKLVTVGAEEKIVGCHLFDESAVEIPQGFAVAIKMGACKADFDNTITIHPINGEEPISIM
jgi:glutathione reductase (NADPH)